MPDRRAEVRMRQGGYRGQGWLIGIVVVVLAAGMTASSLLSARGDDVAARVRAFIAAHPTAPPATIARRTALWGETWEEDAGLGYAAAATMLPRRLVHQPLFQQAQDGTAANLRAMVWPALATIAAVLQRAAHAGRFERGALPSPELIAVLRIARLHAQDQGDLHACVESWLDEAVLWCDRCGKGDHWPFAGAWPEQLVVRLDLAAAALLASGLERLETRWPPYLDVAEALARLASTSLQPGSGRVTSSWRAWRHGFDPRQRELAAVAELTAAVVGMAMAPATWPERDVQWQRLLDRDADTRQSVTSIMLQHFRSAEKSQVEGRASLRLLRLALAFQLGAPLPDLVDPLTGGAFLVRIDGDVATFRSSAAADVPLSRWAKRR